MLLQLDSELLAPLLELCHRHCDDNFILNPVRKLFKFLKARPHFWGELGDGVGMEEQLFEEDFRRNLFSVQPPLLLLCRQSLLSFVLEFGFKVPNQRVQIDWQQVVGHPGAAPDFAIFVEFDPFELGVDAGCPFIQNLGHLQSFWRSCVIEATRQRLCDKLVHLHGHVLVQIELMLRELVLYVLNPVCQVLQRSNVALLNSLLLRNLCVHMVYVADLSVDLLNLE